MSGVEDAGAEEVESGAAEHLPLQDFDLIDGALDPPGAVLKRQACVDGVLVTAQVAGERRHRRQRVPFHVDDPLFEVFTVEFGIIVANRRT